MTESTTAILIDADGVEVSLNGRPLHNPVRAGYPSDIVQIRVDGSGGSSYMAWISAQELVAAIEKVANLGPEPDRTPAANPEPEPLWTKVRERPSRAVKVTPELVRRLAGDDVPPELAGLEAEFDRATGEPVGVVLFDRSGLATIGRYVVLGGTRGMSVLEPEEFERLYEVAT